MAALTALPIDALLPDVLEALRASPNLVLTAPPGAGKTTRVPPAVAEAALSSREHPAVVLLQPRRVAARAAAARIAAERGWRLGDQVGYHIRFDRRLGRETRVRVLTEGILTRQLCGDAFLEGVGCVVLDEFHERSIHTDLALALLREVQTTVRPDLRIVVMSATMDPAPVAAFLGQAPVLQSEGRMHPVEIDYTAQRGETPIWEQAAAAVRGLWPHGDGHMLVFLPGLGEIRRTQGLLGDVDAALHVLHSSVSAAEQDQALQPSRRRKLVLATNIAETSLTIDGVRAVVDSGLARIPEQDSALGLDRLVLRRISRASADQRAGRAGRTAPGRCLRLWTRAEDTMLPERDTPEVHRVDLCSALLALHAYGSRDPRTFGWFERPAETNLAYAESLLQMLGATDAEGVLTERGRQLAALPVHPRIGRLLLAGQAAGCAEQAATLAALLSERDIVADPAAFRQRPARWHGDSDLLERMAMLEGADPADLDAAAVRQVERVREALLSSLRGVRADVGLDRDNQVLDG